jgi:hypothetical protein
VPENTKGPVAIRIVRPYDSEDELLENELETVGKTSIILIGAHPRPTGVILRFEVTLQGGATVLRGEGRVLGHKEKAFRGQPGLSLRFTRLDPKSKGVIDRAVAMREARLSGDLPSMRPSAPSHPEQAEASAPPPPAPAHEPVHVPVSFPAPADPAIEAALTAATPEPPPHDRLPDAALPPTMDPPPVTPPSDPIPIDVGPISDPVVVSSPTPSSSRGPLQAPPDREALLTRLRERRATLSADRVAAILKH